ncbi:phage portal protein [Sporolactobacillus terrae]|uniref:phage portal protein n=1 Tax=Sporolactobacillus terrae TaxID=269673 RepID=UPI00048D6458|nr:phage portal protein [Sporolactobacillus terrae]
MDGFLKYIPKIREQGVTVELIESLINDHSEDHKRMEHLYRRYKAAHDDGVPIFDRSPADYKTDDMKGVARLDNKVNNKLNNSFDSDIVDTKVGYMYGHPISYSVVDGSDTWKKEVQNFLLRGNTEDQDAECGKMATICGYGARLAYIDADGQPSIECIDPWNAIFIGHDITQPEYALYYYDLDGYSYREFYDGEIVYFFSNVSGQLAPYDPDGKGAVRAHMFQYVPLIGIPNNKELMGDAERVLSLIDAYDRTLSDANNEIEQYRLAYLVLKGIGMDDETLAKVKKSGVWELLGDDEDVKYLTKDVNDELIEHHLDRLEQNILRFAKSVNFGDEEFAGNQSGVSLKFKILALENKCTTAERKFTSALRYQFKVLCSAWAIKGLCGPEDYLKVNFQFTRNLPPDILSDAQATAQLQGRVSEKTRLSLLPFITDPEAEMEEMQKEKDEYAQNMPPIDQNQSQTKQNEGREE